MRALFRLVVLLLALLLVATTRLAGQSYGTISTFAGNGVAGAAGDNGPATNAQLNAPQNVIVDAGGNVYIADSVNNRIRKVTPGGTIATVAGTGTAGSGGDNGPAISALLNQPHKLLVDSSGNLYIADSGNNRVRKVDPSGVITTVAGTGVPGSGGDGGPAVNAQLYDPVGLALDSAGNLYIADAYNSKVRKVDTSGIITTYTGTGLPGSTGDGGPAAAATFLQPYALTVDTAGNLYVSDLAANNIRRITPAGIIATLAGTGQPNFGGDGGQASLAQLSGPAGMAFDSAGNLYFADINNNRIRKIDASGIISTVAGDGTNTYTNDGQLSLNAGIGSPSDVVIDARGLMYIAQRNFDVLRIVALAQPSQIIVDGGTGQSTAGGTAFAQLLAAHVIDSTGNALNGITVTFTAPASGASATLSSSTAVTDANGRVSVTATANFTAGSYQVKATVEGVSSPATFDLTNTAPPPSAISFVTQPADTPAGTPINAVTVSVTASGNPVAGTQVTMTAQGPGSVTGTTTANTDSNGGATFSNLIITTAGPYQLRAAAGSVTTLSNSFNITGGTSRIINVLSGNGQSAAVGAAYASPLQVTVLDGYNNSVAGASVTFTAPSSGPGVTFSGPATVTTNSDGVATSPTLTANSQSGAVRVTASTSGASQPATFDLNNTPAPNNKLGFQQQPANTAAGQTISPPVTVQLLDSFGNPVSTAGVAVTLQLNPLTQRSAALGGTTTQNTNAAGLATFANLSVSQTGDYQLIASATSFASAQSNSFTIFAGPPFAIVTAGGTPQSATILTAFANPLAVIVRDASSNPVSGATVTFGAPPSGASATLSTAQAATDATGRASVTATANGLAGSFTVTATVAGVAAPASFALTNVAGGAAILTFVQQPASTTAGATISAVAVKLTDSGGNPVNGVAVTLSAAGGTGTLQGTVNGTTDVTGTATFNDLKITATGTYQLKAVAGSLSALSTTFQITPAAAANIAVFDGNGQTAPVGAPYASPLRAAVTDAFGNPIANVQVTFNPPGSGPSVTFAGSATVTTNASGIAASPAATANQTAGAFQVTASTAGASPAATFNLTNVAGTANQLTFSQQPTNTASAQPITPPVTVQLRDGFGNTVAMAGVSVTIQASPVAGRSRTLAGTTTQTTDASGLATFPALSLNQAGAYTLTAQASGITSATSSQFLVTAGVAATIQATGGTLQSAIVNAAFRDPLQALVTDAAGNPVSGATVIFTAPGSGPSAVIIGPAAVTDATGTASVHAVANGMAGSYTVTATTAGASGSAQYALTNLAAGAANLTFVQQPTGTAAGATMGVVSVVVMDGVNNPLAGVLVTMTAQGGSGTLEGTTSGTTDVTGTATFTDLTIRTAGTYQLRAGSGTLSTLSNSFQITAASTANITVFAGDGQSAHVGTSYSTALAASVRDSFGNPVADAQVTFTPPASGASVTFAESATVTTNPSGIAVAPAATANQTAGMFQVTATTTGVSQPATFNLTNVAGAANKLAFAQQPTGTVAGQPIAPPVTVQLQDSFGNSVAMAGVSVSLLANSVGSGSKSTAVSADTDANGLATFPSIVIAQAGAYTLTALAAGITSATSSPFNVNAGAASSIQATGGTPQTTTIQTAFPVPLQVTVEDAQGNPVSGVSVSFTAPGSGASAALSAPTATTDADGHASVTATANNAAGSYTVTAAAPGAGSASFALTNAAGTAAAITFVQPPQNTPAGSIMPTVSTRLVDSGGNPVAGTQVTVSIPRFPGRLGGTTTVTTDATGLATYSDLTVTVAGTYTMQASTASVSVASGQFTITPATSGQTITAVNGSGQSTHINTSFPGMLQAVVKDSFNNPVAGAAVTFTPPATGASGNFGSPATVTTDEQGMATSPVLTANAVAGTFTVTAATAGAATSAAFTLTNLPGDASKLDFKQQPNGAVAGQAIAPPVTVQLQDSAGNPVGQSGVMVTLQPNGTNRAAPPLGGTTSQPTDNTGLATFSNISQSQAGTYSLVAQAPAVASATSLPFTITAGGANAIQATGGTPQSTVIDTPFTNALQATVIDGFGNPVSGVTVSFTVPGSGASASLSTPSAVTDSAGRASVTATANSVAGTYAVTATASGISGAASFALTNVPAGAAHLTFVQQPEGTTAGATLNAVSVKLTDSGNNPISGIVVAMSAEVGSGRLQGTLTQATDASGTATFSDLLINLAGVYRLRAATGLLSQLSQLFQITAAAGANITEFGGDGQSAAVGTPFETLLRARVADQFGNAVKNAEVTFTAPAQGAGVTFAGSATVITDAQGIATAPAATANQTAGLFQVTAATPGAPQPATFNLTNLAGTANVLAFVQEPADTTAGQAIAPPVKVQLQDSFGNSVAKGGVAVSLQANPVSTVIRSLQGAPTAMTDPSGLATFPNIVINRAGTYTLTAEAAEVASAVSKAFQVTSDAAMSIQAAGGTPQTATILTQFLAPLEVIVTDALGNPVGGVSVTFAAPGSSPSATLSASTATTDASGNASVTATANSAAGAYVVTAAVAGAGSAMFHLTNTVGTPATIAFAQQPRNTPAGSTMAPVSVRLVDSGGNPIAGTQVTVSIPGSSGLLGGTTTIATDATGLATYGDLKITVAGTYTLQASTASVSATSAAFIITPATSGQTITAVDGGGQSAHVDTAFQVPLRALVRDSFSNPAAGVTVTFTPPATGAGGSFGGSATATVTTDEQGIATSPVLTANAVAGTFTVTAAAAGAATPAGFSVTNLPGNASKLAFKQQPGDAVAGQAITPPITVQLQDGGGNPVGQAGVVVTLQSNGTTQLARSLSGTTSQPTDNTGLATFAGISESQAGTYALLAQATGFVSATSDSFTIRAGTASSIQATGGTPQSATIATVFSNPLQATVTDSLGNAVSGVTVTFAAPGSGASATVSAPSAVTDPGGHASVHATANSIAGTYSVTASAPGVTGTSAFALTNLAAPAASLAFVQQPVNTTAGAAISAVTVKVTDSGNNPVGGVGVTMSAQGGGGTLGGTLTIPTDITGTATFNDLVLQAAGTYQLRAAAGPLAALSNPFQIAPAAAVNIVVFGGNGQSAAVGTAYGTPLRAGVQDAFGNPVPGAGVSFVAPETGASVTFAGSATVSTDASGIATAPAATANQTPGAFQVTATTAGAPQPATFNLTNIAGTANKLAFVQQPTDTTAGQPIAPAVTVQVQDSFGNSVAMGGVSVSLQANPVSGRFRTLRGVASANTDATGLATFANISIAADGAYTLTAEATEFGSATSSQFNVTAGAPASIQATGGTPQSTTVLTAFPQPLQATVKDTAGNPVSGMAVTFTAPASGASATLSAAQATTDANGVATVTAIANAVTGNYTVQVTIVGGSSASFSLTNVGGGAGALTFAQQPVNTAAGAPMTVSVKLTDGSSNPVAGVSVTLTVPDNSAILIGATAAPTDATGLATFNSLSIDRAGTFQLQATAGALSILSSSFQITPAGLPTIAPLDGGGQSATVNAPYGLPVRASVRDQYGNPLPGVPVTFGAPASGAGVSFAGSGTVTTDNTGVATSPALMANSQTGTFQVTAAAAGAPSPAVFGLTNLAGTANRLTFVQQPTSTRAGQIITPSVTVRVTDSSGNPVSQAGVHVSLMFQAAGAGGGPPASATTDANGLAAFSSLSIMRAGTYIAQAQASGLASAQSDSFTISAAIPSVIQATAGTPQSAQVSTAFSQVLQATLTDSAGNPVSGVLVVFLAPLAGAGGTFGGANSISVVTDQQGRAAAPFVANSVTGAYIVTATASLVTGQAQFVLANLSNALPNLAFVQQPADSAAGQTIAPPVTVRIVDSTGTPMVTPGVPILLSLASGSGTLSGTLAQTTDNTGTATFSDLSIDLAGAKQLRAISAQDAPAVSNSFRVTAGPAATIVVTSGSLQATTPSNPFPSLLQARVSDSKGNPVAGATVLFALSSSGPGTFSGSPGALTDANGIATAPPLTADNTTGNFNVTATVQGVGAAASFSLTVLPTPTGTLEVLPAQVKFASESGQPAPAFQTVRIVDADGRIEQWSAVSSAPWLTVTPTSGVTPASATVSVSPAGLAPGGYSATITFTTPSGQFTEFLVYEINDSPALVASPTSQLFFAFQQGMPPAQNIFVTSTGRPILYNATAAVSSPSGGSWLKLGNSQGQTPNTLQVSANPTGLTNGVYQGSIILTPVETGLNKISIPVTLVIGSPIQVPTILAVTNAASFHPSGAPGSLMTIFGRAMSDAIYQANTLPLPQTLGPTTVTVNGAPVPLYYVSPTQINFQMPSGQAVGTPRVVVTNAALKASSQDFPVILAAADPGLFVTPDGRAAALNQDLSPNTAATPQPAGAIILVYLTGQGPTTPPVQDGVGAPTSTLSLVNAQVTAQIGEQPADVVFAGLAPGLVGETQVNLRIPQGLAPGDQPVFIKINGVSSNAGRISVR